MDRNLHYLWIAVVFVWFCLLWIGIVQYNDLKGRYNNYSKIPISISSLKEEINEIHKELELLRIHKHNYSTGLPDYHPTW